MAEHTENTDTAAAELDAGRQAEMDGEWSSALDLALDAMRDNCESPAEEAYAERLADAARNSAAYVG